MGWFGVKLPVANCTWQLQWDNHWLTSEAIRMSEISRDESLLFPYWPHTQAKHDILTYYLKGWFPAQSRMARRLLYIDGFAGPGEYEGGQAGSPILVIDLVLKHKFYSHITRSGMELVFLFIEAHKGRFDNLKEKLANYRLPTNLKVFPFNLDFEAFLIDRLDGLEREHLSIAPSFIFIDPFGPTGFPMSLVRRIARQPRSEVLINFSYHPLNQWFLQDPSKHKRIDELFGNDKWREALAIADPRAKESFLLQCYLESLGVSGWSGLSFRMINQHNQTQ